MDNPLQACDKLPAAVLHLPLLSLALLLLGAGVQRRHLPTDWQWLHQCEAHLGALLAANLHEAVRGLGAAVGVDGAEVPGEAPVCQAVRPMACRVGAGSSVSA